VLVEDIIRFAASHTLSATVVVSGHRLGSLRLDFEVVNLAIDPVPLENHILPLL